MSDIAADVLAAQLNGGLVRLASIACSHHVDLQLAAAAAAAAAAAGATK